MSKVWVDIDVSVLLPKGLPASIVPSLPGLPLPSWRTACIRKTGARLGVAPAPSPPTADSAASQSLHRGKQKGTAFTVPIS